jgi:PAS domain S-box-containing protein
MDPMEAPSSPHNTDDANQNGNDTTANTSTSPEEARLVLQKMQEELKLAISVGNIGIWQWDAKSNVVKWSNEQAALYGVEAGEYPNGFEKWLSHVHPDDVARMRNELVSDEQKDYYNYEFRIRHADGSTRWLRARSRVFYDADSQPEYVVGVNFDVTKEKEDDQALLYQKQLLETVTNNTTLALFLMDEPPALRVHERGSGANDRLYAQRTTGQTITLFHSPHAS